MPAENVKEDKLADRFSPLVAAQAPSFIRAGPKARARLSGTNDPGCKLISHSGS